MKQTLALFLIVFGFAQARGASAVRRDANGAVFMAAVEMKDSSGREVLITGMNHIAPDHFYSATQSVIEKWVGTGQEGLLVLREFITCSTSVLDNLKPVPQASVDALVSKSNLFDEPLTLLNATASEAQPVIDALRLVPTACRLDYDNKTKRPSYVIDRNQSWCKSAHEHGVACQFDGFNLFLGTLNYVDADISVDRMPVAVQAAAASLYRSGVLGDNTWNLNRYSLTTNKLLQPGLYFLIEGRNQNLLEGVAKAFTPKVTRILLPWGAEHTTGLVTSLEAQGFHITNVQDVLLGDRSDAGKFPLLDQTLVDSPMPATYGFDQ